MVKKNQDPLIKVQECSKEQHLFKIDIFCIIIHFFTVTFGQFNPTLQINLFLSLNK